MDHPRNSGKVTIAFAWSWPHYFCMLCKRSGIHRIDNYCPNCGAYIVWARTEKLTREEEQKIPKEEIDKTMNEARARGCWKCKNLEWCEDDTSDGHPGPNTGWGCSSRDDIETFKTFPCNRKLWCFEPNE
ncbi:MAG TPA: hypothetical protein P5136_01720 [Methanofastidiosum sp.]|nr:hypothetical protein [Methanofastidiosum sp.]